MFWANRTDKVSGVLLLLFPILSLIGFIAGAPLGEVDPFARADVEDMLRTLNDNFALWIVSLVPFMVQEVLAVAVAALLYLSFRDRSHTLALAGAFAAVAGSVALMVHEVGAMTLAFLSADLLRQGGPGPIAPGDPVILEVARSVSVGQALTALVGQTFLGFGTAAFGTLIVWAPAGERTPPRWLGVAGLFGGVGMLCTWAFLVNHMAGGGITVVAELAILVMFGGLGVWFLRLRNDALPCMSLRGEASEAA
ncbi:MAG: DUF4386 family protein [Chloroflexi bacterium]|nr:DUF4386 family protein [Chloroflexota bacterium]